MENRAGNQEIGRRINTKQNTDTNRNRGDIGNRIGYINKDTLRRHKYQDRFTEETYRTESGIKAALPMYYKQKIMDLS